MCGILLLAHRNARIDLKWKDALMVRDCALRPTAVPNVRRCVAELWWANGGLSLAVDTDQIQKIPPDIVEELTA